MSFHSSSGRLSFLAMVSILLQSCTSGLQGGSIVKTFEGIIAATVMGPQTIDVQWATNSNCVNYQVYLLSSSTIDSVASAAIPPVRLQSPVIASSQPYTIAVGCVGSGGTTGQDVALSATTWSNFNGVATSSLDDIGQNKVIGITWSYLENTGTRFLIYAKESAVPVSLASWGLTLSGGVGSGYSETPICSTYNNKISIGTGGDCDPSPALNPGSTYDFKVVANYPDGTYSTDIVGNGTTQTIPADFTPPNCILTQAGVGGDSASSYLFLRCPVTTSCGGNITTTAYQVVGSTRSVVSDTLSGPGTLRIQPKISTSANNRTIQGLEIEYVCKNVTPNTKSVVRYDGTGTGANYHKKPVLKYGNEGYEAAPVQAYQQHPSHLGQALAIGDYNCNGKPDIALGLPDVTFNSAPYFNQRSSSGAVKIVYDYVQSATGVYSGSSNQYLAFRDLKPFARFGASLSSGNINKDVSSPDLVNTFSCDDLIIGSPGAGDPLNPNQHGTGAAFIFYGHPKGFPQPLDSAGLAANAPTCSGSILSEVCSPVRLSPDVVTWYRTDSGYAWDSTSRNTAGGYYNTNGSTFGYQVSYIRDFNADGYGDIAVSDPHCSWDGETNNAVRAPVSNNIITMTDVGCVYVYWGGPSGIQTVRMGKTPDDEYVLEAPFAKIYPPFPQSGMHFGTSLAGGGDVDGRLPVPVPMNGTRKITLANGNDFIVGAPDFNYTSDNAAGTPSIPNWTVVENEPRLNCSQLLNTDGTGGGNCPIDPIVLKGSNILSGFNAESNANGGNQHITAPWNLAWNTTIGSGTGAGGIWGSSSTKGVPAPSPSNTKLANSTGIAFLYLGRSAQVYYPMQNNLSFTKFPTSILSSLIDQIGGIGNALSISFRDRQNGSQFLQLPSPSPLGANFQTQGMAYNPIDSFYNCGPRGAPLRKSGSNTYKHISCLAGRNNFSVIYPALRTTDSSVSQFGLNVSIAGSKEQNIVALFELNDQKPSAYSSMSSGPPSDLLAFAQGSFHERIRGTSLWEVGIRGYSYPGTAANSCETFSDTAAPTNFGSSCDSTVSLLSRSALSEDYNFDSGTYNAPQPSAKPQTDVNRDGYADVIVSTGASGSQASIFTYYGNYAADFSYQGNSNSFSPNCSINRLATGLTAGTIFGNGLPSGSNSGGTLTKLTGLAPYTTFYAQAEVLKTPSSFIRPQYPMYFTTPANTGARLSYLDDSGPDLSSTAVVYNYQAVGTRGSGAAPGSATLDAFSRCQPYVKTYTTAPSTLRVGDMNNDGLVDAIIGLSADTGNIGKGIVSIAGSSGNGFSGDINFTVNSTNSQVGSAVAGVNWRFLDESSRRDLFVGAKGFNSGSGAVYVYAATNAAYNSPNATLTSTQAAPPIPENSNFPSSLHAEFSKIIGDVNGDGYDDLLIPVRRVDVGGSVYYDGIIYYGSSFGPVTYGFCIANVSSITAVGSSSFTSTDCLGTAGVQGGTLNGAQVFLPQYLSKPSGVSNHWILSVHPAGDVNNDGIGDLLVLDYGATSMDLFFGSTSGLINGSPRRGPSVSLLPQLVTTSAEIMNASTSNHANASTVNGTTQPTSAWSWQGLGNTGSVQNFPLTHGDYNGDGFRDLAITSLTTIPGLDNSAGLYWHCTPAEEAASFSPGGNANCQDETTYFEGLNGSHGSVIVIYGGATGYQTPMDSTPAPVDFGGNFSLSGCKYFYDTCTTTGCTPSCTPAYNTNYLSEVYNTLQLDTTKPVGTGWTVDTSKTACDPTGVCKASIIRNPVFYDTPGAEGVYGAMHGVTFGTALTTADVNNDGIDDLVVGSPNYYLPGYNGGDAGAAPSTGVFRGNTFLTSRQPAPAINDETRHGAVFLYYGAKGVGVVAPSASMVVGDRGLGLVPAAPGSDTAVVNVNTPIFAIYPAKAATAASGPKLEGSTFTPTFSQRKFGLNISAGDFNGDKIDDVVAVSQWGQVYIFYGPLCQFDNDRTTWGTVHSHQNVAFPLASNPVTGTCVTMNLNKTFSAIQTDPANSILISSVSSKSLNPQIIRVDVASSSNGFGSVLLSERPTRALGFGGPGTVIRNKGNLDGDAEGTSDLLLGSYRINDPNVTTPPNKFTGIGYIFFGHATPAAGDSTAMPTTPGIFIGSASYNSALINVDRTNETPVPSCGANCFYHQPVILHPHSPDGLIGEFFNYQTTLGDLNADGTGDLMMPTDDIQYGAEGPVLAPVVTGGGSKLFY